jgi:signal transduction histidine kinase
MSKFIRFERFRAQEAQRIRKELARDFHDELGNHLARIVTYANLLRLSKPELKDEPYLIKLEASANSLMAGTRDFISAINSKKTDLPDLFAAIRDFGENLYDRSPIAFRTCYAAPETHWKITDEFHRQMIFILKEVMTNAFRHSGARNVFFLIKEWNNVLEISLQDDGVGFVPETVPNPGGLTNLSLRAQRINAEIHILSDLGLGTCVRLFYQQPPK